MPPSPVEFLRHILDELDFLVRESTKVDEVEFSKSDVLQRAFARSLEIIGEASKKASSVYQDKYPSV